MLRVSLRTKTINELCCLLHYVCIPTFTTFALPGIVNGLNRVYRAVADASIFFSIVLIVRSESSSAANLPQPLCFHRLIELTARSSIVPCLVRSITTHRPLPAHSISLRFLESASISRLNSSRKRTYERSNETSLVRVRTFDFRIESAKELRSPVARISCLKDDRWSFVRSLKESKLTGDS